MTKFTLAENAVHLGLGAIAESEPPFTGMQWYGDYGQRHVADGAEGRLVSMHTFHESWDSWEMHPKGHEVVICTDGTITLIQEQRDGAEQRITLSKGEYAINEPGCWHTADIDAPATAIFITAGEGTQHRPRS